MYGRFRYKSVKNIKQNTSRNTQVLVLRIYSKTTMLIQVPTCNYFILPLQPSFSLHTLYANEENNFDEAFLV